MSDPYGTCTWTCGECGETYSASGVVGDSKVDRWRRDHKEEHRIEKLSPEARRQHRELMLRAQSETFRRGREAWLRAQKQTA